MESVTLIKFVLFAFQIVYTASWRHDNNCENKAADIVFALDASSSIWEVDFKKQLGFVEKIINKFSIQQNGVRVGVLTFGSYAHTQFNLGDYLSKEEILDAIENIPFSGGGTDTGSAIKHAREIMFNAKNGGRELVDKLMFVITDGYSMNSINTSIEASISKSHGIIMFAVGVGQGLDDELAYIASKPKTDKEQFVFRVDEFTGLDSIKSALIQAACTKMHSQTDDWVQNDAVHEEIPDLKEEGIPDLKVKQYCGGKPADVYFAVDSSSSIWVPNFRKMFSFITEVVDMFDISPRHTRVGVVTYSDGIHPVITLNNDLDTTALKKRLLSVPFLKGSTRTGSALEYIRERGFARGYVRDRVARVVILLTDGQSFDAKKTIEESKRLHDMGVYIFALGIGDQVDKDELKAIASEPNEDFMFKMDSFDALASIKNTLAIKTCTADEHTDDMQNDLPENMSVVCKSEPLDVMYVYDSYSLGKKKSGLVAETIAAIMATSLPRDLRSGIITHSCDDVKSIPLSSYRRGHDIIDALRTTQSATLPRLLYKLRTESYSQEHGGRTQARNIVFLFIDGNLEQYHRVKMATKRLKFKNEVEVYVVAIESKEDAEIGTLCSDPVSEHLIRLSYSEMASLKEKVLQKLCSL